MLPCQLSVACCPLTQSEKRRAQHDEEKATVNSNCELTAATITPLPFCPENTPIFQPAIRSPENLGKMRILRRLRLSRNLLPPSIPHQVSSTQCNPCPPWPEARIALRCARPRPWP